MTEHGYTLNEVAAAAGRSREAVYLDVREGRLAAHKVGRVWYITPDDFNKYVDSVYEEISGYKGLSIKYLPNVDLSNMDNFKNIMKDKLMVSYDRELFMGGTLIGPHRDDFSFVLSDSDLLLYGSQGQIKMAILALKLSEIDVFKDVCGEYPVLLLDDLFSELDLNKRNKVINYLNRDIQTIVTTTDLKNIDKHLVKSAKIFKINNGKIVD